MSVIMFKKAHYYDFHISILVIATAYRAKEAAILDTPYNNNYK